jgi:hypothetical protein
MKGGTIDDLFTITIWVTLSLLNQGFTNLGRQATYGNQNLNGGIKYLHLLTTERTSCRPSGIYDLALAPSFFGSFLSLYYITYHQFKIIMIVGYTYKYRVLGTKQRMKYRNSAALPNICCHSTNVRRLPANIDHATQLPISTTNLGEKTTPGIGKYWR